MLAGIDHDRVIAFVIEENPFDENNVTELEIFFCLMLSIAGNVKGSLVAVTISARTTSGIASIAMRRIANALLLIVALLNDKSGLRENSVQRCDLESYLRSPLCLIICVKK